MLVIQLKGFGCMVTGLGADGASVMSGEWAGVQALLKRIYPWLIYIHCAAHRLNLVVVTSLKGTCKNILTIVDKLHSLFSYAKTNYVFMKVQRETKVKVMAMPERSETRCMVFYVLCTRYYLCKIQGNPDDLWGGGGGVGVISEVVQWTDDPHLCCIE